MAHPKSTNQIAQEMETYFDRLWPICRSITGPGFRDSLSILSELMPMKKMRFPTGKKVLDWIVPKEWRIRDAYLIDPNGKKRADFKVNNLHIVNYSVPFRGRMTLKELRPRLYTIPDQPTAIPYRTAYYTESWGFCVANDDLKTFPEGEYEVVIDSSLEDGFVELGEAVIPGESSQEIFFSTYLCHPSMANNELSGPLLTAFLYQKILELAQRRFTYRFVICPETIGSICYLSKRGTHLTKKMVAGYQVTCVGNPGPLTYKKSRCGNTLADRAAMEMLKHFPASDITCFNPVEGSDERQYCSPGFKLPLGSLMRTRYMKYPEYHTSLDNKEFIRFSTLIETLNVYFSIVKNIESNGFFKNTVMKGEPQLGRRGMYPPLGAAKTADGRTAALMWSLSLLDGSRDLFDVAEVSGIPMQSISEAVNELCSAGLLERLKNK